MYDGSAGFDLPDAIYLGRALAEAGYRWYEEPIHEFSVTAYKWLAERVDVPLLVGETSDGSHLNTADFIASGCATYVRTSANHRGGMTGAMRIAHLADSFRLRAEVHGPTEPAVHLCMAIPNCTYYESLVTSNPVEREPRVGAGRSCPRADEPGHCAAGLRARAARRRWFSAVHQRGGSRLMKSSTQASVPSFVRSGLASRSLRSSAAGAASGSSARRHATKAAKASAAPLVVWYDAARAAYVKEYKKTHPDANIKWVLYSGDNNGDGTLQSKFALYNRVGWKAGVAPDVVFDEENYEAGWLGEPPFNDLLDLKPVHPEERLEQGRGPGRLHDQRQASLPAQRQRRERALGQHEAVEPVLPGPVASDHLGAVRSGRSGADQEPPGLLHR